MTVSYNELSLSTDSWSHGASKICGCTSDLAEGNRAMGFPQPGWFPSSFGKTSILGYVEIPWKNAKNLSEELQSLLGRWDRNGFV